MPKGQHKSKGAGIIAGDYKNYFSLEKTTSIIKDFQFKDITAETLRSTLNDLINYSITSFERYKKMPTKLDKEKLIGDIKKHASLLYKDIKLLYKYGHFDLIHFFDTNQENWEEMNVILECLDKHLPKLIVFSKIASKRVASVKEKNKSRTTSFIRVIIKQLAKIYENHSSIPIENPIPTINRQKNNSKPDVSYGRFVDFIVTCFSEILKDPNPIKLIPKTFSKNILTFSYNQRENRNEYDASIGKDIKNALKDSRP